MIAILDRVSDWYSSNNPFPAGIPARAMVEGLEAREMFSAAPAVAPLVANAKVPATVTSLKHVSPKKLTSVLPLTITNVALENGSLVAHGLLGNTPFTTPVNLTVPSTPPTGAASPAADPSTSILALHLGPIHLNLLGLNVDTSEICLNINANSGPGNLLGNLLTDVANLLNGGTSLGNVLGGLSTSQLTTLLNGITGLLNGALGAITAPGNLAGVGGTTAGATNILHLSLGPVDLNLLGLEVQLNNCSGGPITVDITAQPGAGNLLGNLLGGLSHLLDTPANQSAILAHLNQVADAIGTLI